MSKELLRFTLNEQNRDPRAACVLVMDVSGSMQGDPIAALERGYGQFVRELQDSSVARKRTEVAVVTFGSKATTVSPFREGRDLEPIKFEIDGSTNMAAGINLALDELEDRKRQYRSAGIEYYRPWFFLLTDGEPDPDRDGSFARAVARLNAAEAARGVSVFAVGVGSDVNYGVLKQMSLQRGPAKLAGLKFGEMFLWLSSSMDKIYSSTPGSSDEELATLDEQVELDPPGWTSA